MPSTSKDAEIYQESATGSEVPEYVYLTHRRRACFSKNTVTIVRLSFPWCDSCQPSLVAVELRDDFDQALEALADKFASIR